MIWTGSSSRLRPERAICRLVLNVTHVNIVFFRLGRVRHAIRFAHQPVSAGRGIGGE
jgi:hypothetical protein